MSDSAIRSGPLRRGFDWLFRSRETGRIVVAQFPNWPLALWLVATIARRVSDPSGTTRDFLVVVADIALVIWAGDEIVRGVNPFRRALGVVVLGGFIYALASR